MNLEFQLQIFPVPNESTSIDKLYQKINSLNLQLKHISLPYEFIPNTEGMTDFVFYKGNVVHQVTYKYSDGYKERYKDDCIRIPLPDGITIR